MKEPKEGGIYSWNNEPKGLYCLLNINNCIMRKINENRDYNYTITQLKEAIKLNYCKYLGNNNNKIVKVLYG